MAPPSAPSTPPVDLDDLTFTLVALLRADGHLSNVLTHVASGDWRAVEQAIASILHPRTRPKALSDITRNILRLICDDRGVTGPIMRSVFFDIVARTAGRPQMKRLEKKIRRLRHRMALEAAPAPQAHPPANNEPARTRPVADRSGKTDDREPVKPRDKWIYPSERVAIGKAMALPNAAASC